MTGDPPAWQGDVRHPDLRLSQDELREARAEHQRAESAQETLDSVMRSVRDGIIPRHGADLVGLEHSLKSEESFLRKVADQVGAGRDSVDEAIKSRAHDLNRYTLTFPEGSYVDGVKEAIAELRQQGLALEGGRDSWDDPIYKGINTTWSHEATGRRVEVQFHTPDSFRVKQETHSILGGAAVATVRARSAGKPGAPVRGAGVAGRALSGAGARGRRRCRAWVD